MLRRMPTPTVIKLSRSAATLAWTAMALSLAFILNSCASGGTAVATAGPAVRVILVDFEEDRSASPGNGVALTAAFAQALTDITGGRYALIGRGTVQRALAAKGLAESDLPAKSLEIGAEVGADAILTGRVTAWKDGSLTRQATVGFAAQCTSVETGDLLWSIAHTDTPFKASMESRVAQVVAYDVAMDGLKKIADRL